MQKTPDTQTSPHAQIRTDWLDKRREDIIWPDLPVIDPHHHLWDRPGSKYLFDELREDITSGHNIVGTLFVQCRSMYKEAGNDHYKPVGEVEFANGIAARFASGLYGKQRGCAGIIGCADLTLGHDIQPVLERLIAAGGMRLKGIRNSTAWHEHEAVRSNPILPPKNLLIDPRFSEGVGHLEKYGLRLDVWAYHTQLPLLHDLAKAHANVPIIINHLGGPLGVGPYTDRKKEVFQTWQSEMRRLAGLPNTSVKLGGFGLMVMGHQYHKLETPPSSDLLAAEWRPYVETLIEMFGTKRCMYESNFPVDKGMFSYHVLWNAFKKLSMACSQDEIFDLFHETARRIYHLDLS